MATGLITDLALGKLLQISYINTLRDQFSGDLRDFEMVKMLTGQEPSGRQVNFSLKTGRGPAATQYVNPGAISAFPRGQRSKPEEFSAFFKNIYSTVEIDLKTFEQLKRSSDRRYAEDVATEMADKALESKRRIGADLHGDGTGVMLTATAADDTDIAAGQVTVSVSSASNARGFIGWAIEDDVYLAYSPNGATERTPSGASNFYGWLVVEKDRRTNTVVLQAVNENYAPAAGTITASNIVNGDLFYRVGQPSIPDLSGTVTADYGTLTEVFPGLESLGANDGRLVHGITMGTKLGASVNDDGGTLSFDHIENVLNDAKLKVGESSYAYPKMLSAPETHSFFIKTNETDRRLNSVTDQHRGGNKFVYQHRTDAVEFMASEFSRRDRIWFSPESKQNQGPVLEMHMTDFAQVAPNDMSAWRMRVNSAGRYIDVMETNMEASGTALTRHPRALAVIKGFSLT
jgi:hypothetical protein